MKILSRKLTAIVMLAIFAVSAFAIGFVSMVYKPAIAESTESSLLPSNITNVNIEDLGLDLTKPIANGGLQYAHTIEASQQSTLNGSDIVFSDTLNQDKLNTLDGKFTAGGKIYGVYTTKQKDTDLHGSNISNTNKYDGNLSIYTESITQKVFCRNRIAFRLGNAGEVALTFRLFYQEGYEYNFFENIAGIGNLNQYYLFKIATDGAISVGIPSETAGTYTVESLLTTLKQTNENATTLYDNGDDLLITCGSFHTGTEEEGNQKTNYYFKIVNVTKGYTSVEILQEGTYKKYSNAYFGIDFYGISGKYLQFNLGGVNRPLFTPIEKNITVNVDSDDIQTLSDVKLPNGYTFKQTQTSIDGLTSAMAEFDYYGQKTDCRVIFVKDNDITNIEDKIQKQEDLRFSLSTDYNIQNINQLETKECTWGTDIYGKYTTVSDKATTTVTFPKISRDAHIYGDYDKIVSEDGKTITATIPYNANDYTGNISVFAVSKAQTSASVDFNAGGKNSVVSFRTNFETNRRMIMYARTEARNTNMIRSVANNYYVYFDYTTFDIYFNQSNILSLSHGHLLAKAQIRNPNAGLTSLINNGENIIITYGVYDTYNELNEVDGTYLYFHIVNSNGYVVVDETIDVTEQEKTVNEPRVQNYIGIQTTLAGGDYYQGSILPVTIAGVNQPLLGYDYAIAEELSADNVGKSVSTLTLKDGYAIADATQVLTVGENKVKVNYTGEYYGSTKTVSAIVTVNVKANNVTIKDMAGADIQTAQVGSSFTLPTLDRAKMFVAYKAQDGKLYKQGETVEVSSDCSFTLTEVDVSVLEKIEIRLSTVDNRFGGLRFTAKILTADLDKLAGSEMTVKSLIVPAGIEDFSGAQELANTFEDGDYTYAYFTVTNLNYYNFNRQFTGSLIIDVPYESGNDYAVSNVVSGSAYDIASELLAQNVEARANGQALFNGTAEEIISRYAYGVIDLTYTENTLSYSNTLSNAWFELNGVENESVEDGVYSATVKVNVLEGANGFITDDNYSAPVIVRVGDGYKVAVVSARTLESGVLSLNIQVKIA